MIELTGTQFEELYDERTKYIVNDPSKGEGIIYDNDTQTTSIHNVKLLDAGTFSHRTPFYNLVTADFTGLDVSELTEINYWFTSDLESINLSNWDVSNVTSLEGLFDGCINLTTLDLSGWDVSNVISLSCAFRQCWKLSSIDLSTWDVSKVKYFGSMFDECTSLTTLNLSGWNTSSAESSDEMFDNTPNLQSIITDANTNLSGISADLPETVVVYNSADERLVVKGNERITRQLKVQGDIIQDEGKKASLPKIKSNEIATTSLKVNGFDAITTNNVTNVITENSASLITSGAVFTGLNTTNANVLNLSNYVNNIHDELNELHNNFDVANLVATNATITDLNVTNILANGFGVITTNDVTDAVTLDDNRVITSGAVYNAIGNASINFDATPTAGSTNAVTSEGILNYVDTQVTLAIAQVLNTGF